MSEHKYLKKDFSGMPSEEKLQVLRHEVLRIYVRLEAYVHLLLLIDKDEINQLQPESFKTIEKIKDAVSEIHDVVEALT